MPLYVLDSNTDDIYPVDGVGGTNPGRAGDAVFTDSDSGLLIGGVSGLAWDGSDIFMSAGTTAANSQLFTIAIDADSATLIGSFRLNGATPPGVVHGMTFDGTNLYGVMYSSGLTPVARLVTIDRTTGALTVVGTATNFGAVGENIPQALAWDGTDLWVVGFTVAGLIRVNKTTGIGTRVGTATQFGVSETTMSGLTWDGTNLYGVGRANDALYTIDRTTGVATQVGSETRFGKDIRNPHGLVSTDFPAPVSPNTAPTWTTTQTDWRVESIAVNTTLFTLVATDADGHTLTYSVRGTDASFFGINDETGVVFVRVGLVRNATYNVTAVASDGQAEATLDLTITTVFPGQGNVPDPSVNRAPTWTTTETVYELPANVAVNTIVASLVASDADGNTLSYSLTGSDAGLFAISSSGVVTVASALSNDTTYNVTAVVSDGTLQATLALTITVVALGETPMQPVETPTTLPPIPSGSFPQIEGLHEYRERFDVVRANPFGVVRSNVEMIKHRGDTRILRPAEAAGLTFALSIVDYTPVYAIPDLHVNDWIVEHNPDGWTEAPDPTAVAVWVVQGPVEIADAKKQVIVTKIT